MAKKRQPKARPKAFCAVCGSGLHLLGTEGGWVCEACTATLRQGKDHTTQSVRELQQSMRQRSQMIKHETAGLAADPEQVYLVEAQEALALDSLQEPTTVTLAAGGEVLPQVSHDLRDTLAAPGAAALDASVERLNLISAFGTDVAAMALDAADSIQASNSFEKMLSHQLAVAHRSCMNLMSKAALETDTALAIKQANLATRLMDVYQRGMVTLKRLRSTGEQQITVQHVHIASGAQAVVGSVKTGGRQ